MELIDYINLHYDSQLDFAKTQNISKQQVTQWLNKKFIVVNNELFSSRRKLKIKSPE